MTGLLVAWSALPASPFAYVTNQGSNDVSVVDLATNRTVATVPVGQAPAGIAVHAATHRAYVSNPESKWRGAFYRGYPGNNPPPDQNDEAAVKAITGVYQSGLANLKVILEK